jgi:hypothetical protein
MRSLRVALIAVILSGLAASAALTIRLYESLGRREKALHFDIRVN